MPPSCAECGHAWQDHYNREFLRERDCVTCEDEAYFEDRAELLCCQGYVPERTAA